MTDENGAERDETQAAGEAGEGEARRGRRVSLPILIAALMLLVVASAAGYQVLKRPADVSRGEEVPFVEEEAPKPKKKKRAKGPQTVNWPMFGFDRARTRNLNVRGIKPPFKQLWRYSDKPLLEFPPIYVKGVLYLVDNDGRAFAFDASTGKKIWRRQIAELNATSPAYSEGRLYIANLRPGQLLCLNAKNGRTIWRKELPARTESSPVVVGKRVFFGAEDGNLYAVDKRNGRTIWATRLAGAIKAAPAYKDGILYVGDYGGEMNAVRARDGAIVWQAGSQGASFARTGEFYSTPAVAFGRVYSGNNDSRVYSFDAKTGELAWTRSTGGYVYSGPTVARTEKTPPTVYIGSFDGNIYALDARTGDTRWTQSAGGPVIGSLSVIGNTVYVASFSPKQTRGFDIRSGKQVFEFHTGAYMPVISDGRRIYLTGYSSLRALEPISHKELRRERRAKAKRKAARQKARRQAKVKAKAKAKAKAAKKSGQKSK
jgi:outer membrane protein assembly factor BamB